MIDSRLIFYTALSFEFFTLFEYTLFLLDLNLQFRVVLYLRIFDQQELCRVGLRMVVDANSQNPCKEFVMILLCDINIYNIMLLHFIFVLALVGLSGSTLHSATIDNF